MPSLSWPSCIAAAPSVPIFEANPIELMHNSMLCEQHFVVAFVFPTPPAHRSVFSTRHQHSQAYFSPSGLPFPPAFLDLSARKSMLG